MLLITSICCFAGCTQSKQPHEWSYQNILRNDLLAKKLPTYVVGKNDDLGITQQGILYLKISNTSTGGIDTVCGMVYQEPYPYDFGLNIYNSSGHKIQRFHSETNKSIKTLQQRRESQYIWHIKKTEYPLSIRIFLIDP